MRGKGHKLYFPPKWNLSNMGDVFSQVFQNFSGFRFQDFQWKFIKINKNYREISHIPLTCHISLNVCGHGIMGQVILGQKWEYFWYSVSRRIKSSRFVCGAEFAFDMSINIFVSFSFGLLSLVVEMKKKFHCHVSCNLTLKQCGMWEGGGGDSICGENDEIR